MNIRRKTLIGLLILALSLLLIAPAAQAEEASPRFCNYDGDDTTLSSQSGWEIEYYADGIINEGWNYLTTDLDAFDGINELYIDGNCAPATATATMGLDGRELLVNTQTINGVDVSRRVFMPEQGAVPWIRMMDYMTNNGMAQVSFNYDNEGNLGSDTGTAIFADSSGDNILVASDRWFVSDDAEDGTVGWDPALAFNYFGAGGTGPFSVTTTGVAGEDDIGFNYPIVLDPGETAIVMWFVSMAHTRAEAITAAQYMDTLPVEALAGISATDAANIINWDVTLPTNPAPAGLDATFSINENGYLSTYDTAYVWSHVDPAGGAYGEWYRLVVDLNGSNLYDAWYAAADICTDGLCSVPVDYFAWAEGAYEWYVQAWNQSVGFFDDSAINSFTLDFAPTHLPSTAADSASVDLYVEQSRPVYYLYTSYDATDIGFDTTNLWMQIWVGPAAENAVGVASLDWVPMLDVCPRFDEYFECEITFDGVFEAGNYDIWAQAWGPAGFSTGGPLAGAESWVQLGSVSIPNDAAALPDTLGHQVTASNNVVWSFRSLNSSWFEFILEPANDDWTWPIGWFSSTDLDCELGGLCYLTLDSLDNAALPAGDYVMRIRGWAPGGFSTGGPQNDGYAEYTFTLTYPVQ